ncbi:MAG: arsenate reductase (glutaredoxin), partial [Alphaproteobacteria bacterium]|nr:arsenate reductase (glutaredoxin) [Alphaproteobacteria bacterium]
DIVIYHNPKCSNSRGALALLEAKGLKPKIVEYVKTPLTLAQLKDLAAQLARTAGAKWPGLRDGMMRTKEPAYAELKLDKASDAALLKAIAEHPALMNRPIVVTAKGARLCRPPELVQEIL